MSYSPKLLRLKKMTFLKKSKIKYIKIKYENFNLII